MGYGKPVNLHSRVEVILPERQMLTHHLGSNTWDIHKITNIQTLFGQIAKRINPEFQPVGYWVRGEKMIYKFDIYYPSNINVFTEIVFEQILREIENKLSIMLFKESEYYDVLDDIDTDPCPNINTNKPAQWHQCDLCKETPSRVIRISKTNLDKLLVRT